MISLSTMWAVDRFPRLAQFFDVARGQGYQTFELNHQLAQAMVAELRPGQAEIPSIHDPCPRPEGGRLPLLSSLEEAERRAAVRLAERSLRTADRLGARRVILHLGAVEPLAAKDRELVRVHRQEGRSPHHDWLCRSLANARLPLVGPRLEAVCRSLRELEPLARSLGLVLALENRAYLHEIPSLPEAEELLETLPPEVFGYWHDSGHAQRLHSHGLWAPEAWLQRLAGRLVGCHLHDCRGTRDHLLPGEGQVDFPGLAAALPPLTPRVAELRPTCSPEEIRQARERFIGLGLAGSAPAEL